MPIKPENKKLYPKDWKDIRETVLNRAKNKCEFCGIDNYSIGFRNKDGSFHSISLHYDADCYDETKLIRIVLTIAHLDHDPTNNSYKNLKALCQRCHNNYDKKHRQQNARATRMARKAHKELF